MMTNLFIRSVFEEGDPILESTDYKAHFRIVIEQPTSITLTKISLCPGYPSKMRLHVHGDYKLVGNTIQWIYSYNDSVWKSVDLNIQNFELSHDGMELEVRNINKDVLIKVTAMTQTDELSAEQKVEVLSKLASVSS